MRRVLPLDGDTVLPLQPLKKRGHHVGVDADRIGLDATAIGREHDDVEAVPVRVDAVTEIVFTGNEFIWVTHDGPHRRSALSFPRSPSHTSQSGPSSSFAWSPI